MAVLRLKTKINREFSLVELMILTDFVTVIAVLIAISIQVLSISSAYGSNQILMANEESCKDIILGIPNPVTNPFNLKENACSASTLLSFFKRITFAAVGDWDCKSNTNETIANINNFNPQFALGLGDYSYSTTPDCWISEIEGMNSALLQKLHIAIGNHDVFDPTNPNSTEQTPIKDYLKLFNLKKPYYSFNHKYIHFTVIATNGSKLDKGSAQYKFILNDLKKVSADRTKLWKIVFFHIPAYTSPSGPEDEGHGVQSVEASSVIRDRYQPLFDKYKVDLVLEGHVHNYQRTFPLLHNSKNVTNPIITNHNITQYNNPKGVVFAIVGTGGKKLNEHLGTAPSFIAYQQDQQHGYLNVGITLHGFKTILNANFVANNGTTLDHFTITKPLGKINKIVK